MRDAEKTKAQLVGELQSLREALAETGATAPSGGSPPGGAVRTRSGYLAAILERSHIGIVSVDSKQRIVLFNQGAEKVFGYTAGEVEGRPLDLLIPQRFVEAHRGHIEEFAGASVSVRHVSERGYIAGRRKNGEEFPAEGSISRVEYEGEIYFTVMLRDITARQQENEEMRGNEQRYRRIFDFSNDAIFILDPAQDRILDANPKACEMLEYSREELVSTPVSAIHPDEMSAFNSFTRTVFELGHGWTNELTCTTKTRRVVPAEISASTVELAGRPLMIAMIRDTSERTQAEEARRELAVVEERNRLARDLHDSVSQSIYSLTLFAEARRRLAKSGDVERLEDHLGELGKTSQQALKEMRLLVYELRPAILEGEGIVGALQHRLDSVEGRSGVEATLRVDGAMEVPAPLEVELYRVA